MVSGKSVVDITNFKEILKKNGLKSTSQRLAVHEVMLKLGHASADMVAEQLSDSGVDKISIASIYNVLSTLADLKIYSRRLSSNNKMYFDVNNFKHIHLYDRVNNEYKDVIDEELLGMVESYFKKRRFRGYTVEGVDVQLICRPRAPRKK